MRCSEIYRFYDVGIHRMQVSPTAAAAGLGVASLTFDSIRAAEMNELRAQLRDELRHDPFRVSALSFSNLRGGGRASRPLKRVNLPICIDSLRDAHGHDISHYLCDTENFRADCSMQGLQEEDALVLIPDEKKPWLLGEFEGRWSTRRQGGEWGTDARDGARTGVSERLPSQPRGNVGAVRMDTSACRCRSDMLRSTGAR